MTTLEDYYILYTLRGDEMRIWYKMRKKIHWRNEVKKTVEDGKFVWTENIKSHCLRK